MNLYGIGLYIITEYSKSSREYVYICIVLQQFMHMFYFSLLNSHTNK